MLPVTPEVTGGYTPLPESSARGCTHCGAPARFIRAPTTLEEATSDRERLCARCYNERVHPATETSLLDDPAVWNPPEGDDQTAEPEPIPATYITSPEPDLPDLPDPDAVPGLDEAGVRTWIDRLCAAECVRSPGTRYAVGLPPAALRAELRTDLGDQRVRQAYDQHCAARRQAWERECALPRYEEGHRRPALEAEARRLAAEGYDAIGVYHGLLTFNQDRCLPPLYEVPLGPDGDVEELRDLAEETYQSLPLSALRVRGLPETLDYPSGPLGFVRNDRRAKKMTLWTTVKDKDSGAMRSYQDGIVLNVAIEELIVRVSPRGAVTQYEILFVGLPRIRLKVVGTLNEILGRLQEEGLVINDLLLKRVLPGLIQTAREQLLCAQSDEEYLPGFYPARYRDPATMGIALEDGIRAVDSRLPPLSRSELRRALEFLDEIVTRWFSYSDEARARIATILKWTVVAPFGYIRKHLRIPTDYVVLHGSSQTGKSVAGQLALSVWARNDSQQRKPFGGFNTEARIGEALAESTYPVVVDEMDLSNDRLHEILKNSWESLVSREPLTASRQRQPRDALAGALLTTNLGAPVPDGLRNRCAVMMYSLKDRDWTLKNQASFQHDVLPQLRQLEQLGSYCWAVVQRNPGILSERSWDRLGQEMMTHAYQYAGLAVPQWVYDSYDGRADTTVEAQVAVALAFRDLVNRVFSSEFQKFRSQFCAERNWDTIIWDLPKKLDLLLAANAIGPVHAVRRRGAPTTDGRCAVPCSDDIEEIRIDKGIFLVKEFEESPEVVNNIHKDLENLARVLGVDKPEYVNVQVGGKRTKRIAITVPKGVLLAQIEAASGDCLPEPN